MEKQIKKKLKTEVSLTVPQDDVKQAGKMLL